MSASDRLRDEIGEQSEVEARPEPRASTTRTKTSMDSGFARANEIDTTEVLTYLGVAFEQVGEKTLATCPGCGEPGALVCAGGGVKCLRARCSAAGPRSHPGLRTNIDLVMAVRGHSDAVAALRELQGHFGLGHVAAGDAETAEDSGSGGAPLPPPIPIDDIGVLPPFPVDALPPWLASWVTEVSTFTQTPLDLAACLSLAVLATALQQAITVQIKPGYVEPVSLFIVVVMPPGERKSPVVRVATAPVLRFEHERAKLIAPARRHALVQREVLERQLKDASTQAAESGDPTDAVAVADSLAEHVVPAEPRYVVDDVTPERLAKVLAEQGGRIAILSAEGGAFAEIITGKRYSGGTSHLDLLLKGHDGDSVRIERVSTTAVCIDNPAITVGVALQPAVLNALAQHRDRGLTGRLLIATPKSLLGTRMPDPPPVSDATASEYTVRITELLSLGDRHRTAPVLLSLDADALGLFHQLAADVEGDLGPGGELAPIADWAAKIVGRTARLAAVMHVATTGDVVATSVDASTFANATAITSYFIAHAKAAHMAMGLDPAVNLAKRMLEALRRKQQREVSARDLRQAVRGYRPTNELCARALGLLVEHGWLVPLPPPSSPRPGRPHSTIYAVHPQTLKP